MKDVEKRRMSDQKEAQGKKCIMLALLYIFKTINTFKMLYIEEKFLLLINQLYSVSYSYKTSCHGVWYLCSELTDLL